jgi:hypothetical protein
MREPDRHVAQGLRINLGLMAQLDQLKRQRAEP